MQLIRITTNFKTQYRTGFKYLIYRVLRPLLKLNYRFYKFFNPDTPWMSADSIEFLKKYIKPEMQIFEFGSGLSTSFYASKAKKVVSVEHFEKWYEIVKQKFKEKKINNVEYLFIPQQAFIEKEKPNHFDFKIPVNWSYENYFNSILNYPDETFDIVIVDGRARVECCFNAINKVKNGGIIILDNSERDRYKEIFHKLRAWKFDISTTGLTDTTIFYKK